MQTIKMDFQSQSTPPVVPVMQSDAQSRFIGIALYNGGVLYDAPEGAIYTVQYSGPGANNMGWYDTITLPSGTRKAVVVDSDYPNVVTLELAEQALRVNGNVFVNLCVVTNTGYMLRTFPIICRVTGAAFTFPFAVKSFFYVTGLTSSQWLAYVTACQDAQKRAEDAAAKFVTDPTLKLEGKAADAAKVGEAVNAEATRAKAAEEENAKGVGRLKEDLDNNVVRPYRKNLFDKNSVMVGYRLYVREAGKKQTYTTDDAKCIVRILIEGGKAFGLTKVSGYSFVDNENTLVTATTMINSLTTHTVSAPSEAKFIWVQVEGEHLNQAQVEYGSPTEYMEYGDFSSIIVGNKEILPIPFISEEPSNKNVYSSKKTDEKIQEEIGKIKLLYIINNKNLVNPEFYLGEYRFYKKEVGDKQTYTSASGKAAYRLPAEENKTYTFTNIEFVSFVDSNDILVEDSKVSNGIGVSIFSSPIGTKFMFVSSVATRNLQIEIGNKSTMYEPFESDKYIALKGDKYICTDDLPVISGMDLTTVVNPQMTRNEFIDAINSKIAEYAELCKCSTMSFNKIIKGNGYNNDWDFIFKTVNHNLRKDVAVSGKSFEMICSDINKAFKERISRFCDAKLETENSRDFSLNTGFQADEPSAIVSEDGNTLYIYAHLKRISTTDGVNWTEPIDTILTGATDKNYIMHNNVNLIDGTYYMIGATKNTGGNLVLYTSTDGVNFAYNGILFKSGETFGGSYVTESFGNTYLIKEYGSDKFYLYVEYHTSRTSWIISVAICDDIFHVNSDGTIGNWIFADSNPIIISPNNDYSREASSAGNPDFAKGMDNRPVKVDGKYYMYFHSTIAAMAHIMRAKSSDLINWEIEGIILDNRDIPTNGDKTSGNADACIIEFKGRTYLFYTWDINDSSVEPYIKYMVDDRPLHELLKLRP